MGFLHNLIWSRRVTDSGGGGGAGGDSDFSTAEVTLIYTHSGASEFVLTPQLPMACVENGKITTVTAFGAPSTPVVTNAILYNGVQDNITLEYLSLTGEPTIQGDCELYENESNMPFLRITGDCSITIDVE